MKTTFYANSILPTSTILKKANLSFGKLAFELPLSGSAVSVKIGVSDRVSPKSAKSIIWERYFDEHSAFISSRLSLISPHYPKYWAQLGWNRFELPTQTKINRSLRPTGWAVGKVPDFAPARQYLRLLASKILPIAQKVRQIDHLDYSPQPDLLHDLVGHVPFTFDPELMKLAHSIGRAALAAKVSPIDRALYEANHRLSILKSAHSINSSEIAQTQERVRQLIAQAVAYPSAFSRISRLYLWVFEFGFLIYDGTPRAIGAALLSSRRDLTKITTGEIPTLPFSEEVLHREVSISGDQEAVFVITRLKDVYDLVERVSGKH